MLHRLVPLGDFNAKYLINMLKERAAVNGRSTAWNDNFELNHGMNNFCYNTNISILLNHI